MFQSLFTLFLSWSVDFIYLMKKPNLLTLK